MNWYLEVLKKYAVFNGRSRRKEYWYFGLINFIILTALTIIGMASENFSYGIALLAGSYVLAGIYVLAILIPSIAVTVRRLHDTDHSGWWLLVTWIPIIGPFVLLIFTIQNSSPGQNQYGANPKEASSLTA